MAQTDTSGKMTNAHNPFSALYSIDFSRGANESFREINEHWKWMLSIYSKIDRQAL